MNPEALEYLQKILTLEPAELTSEQVGFLRARREYLSAEDKAKYSVHLQEKKEVKKGNK